MLFSGRCASRNSQPQARPSAFSVARMAPPHFVKV
jgi:hypothetical protein